MSDGKKIIVKAVDSRSHELDITRYLTSSSHRHDPLNHTIPVIEIIPVPEDRVSFVILEEWPASFAHCTPSTSRSFIHAMRQCVEGIYYMHSHSIAHLDISCANIMTNCSGSCAYIDFELSRRFSPGEKAIVRGIRGTELPPEIERGEESSPFKVDMWALGMTLLRAYKASGVELPHFMEIIQPMLHENPSARPSASMILHAMDRTYSDVRIPKRKSGAPIN